jgi:hypothetical protein
MKKLPDNQIAFYQSPDGSVNIEVLYAEENIWLTQKKMAELFDTTKQNISLHLNNIFKGGELSKDSVVKDFLTTASDGKSYQTQFYSLEACFQYFLDTQVSTAYTSIFKKQCLIRWNSC